MCHLVATVFFVFVWTWHHTVAPFQPSPVIASMDEVAVTCLSIEGAFEERVIAMGSTCQAAVPKANVSGATSAQNHYQHMTLPQLTAFVEDERLAHAETSSSLYDPSHRFVGAAKLALGRDPSRCLSSELLMGATAGSENSRLDDEDEVVALSSQLAACLELPEWDPASARRPDAFDVAAALSTGIIPGTTAPRLRQQQRADAVSARPTTFVAVSSDVAEECHAALEATVARYRSM